MKKTLLLALAMCSGILTAQDTITRKPISEIYLSVSNVNPLSVGLRYKTQIGKKTFLKLGVVDLQYRNENSYFNSPTFSSTNNKLYSGGVLFGIEFRKKIIEKLTFYHGPNIGFSLNYSETKQYGFVNPTPVFNSYLSYTAQLPYTFGFLFQLSREFFLAAELNPGVYYTEHSNGRNNSVGLNLSNNFALLSMVYRF